MLTDNVGQKVDRWTRRLRAGHQGRGINWGVRLTGFCTDCGKPIAEKETFVADGIKGERCKWCYFRFLEE